MNKHIALINNIAPEAAVAYEHDYPSGLCE
jgi:hypothetical protein